MALKTQGAADSRSVITKLNDQTTNSSGFYEAKIDDGSLPVYIPLDPRRKPDISIEAERQYSPSYPCAELAHTYLTILDELWRLKEITLIQKPFDVSSQTFNNVGLRFQPIANSPTMFTTRQATWATLELLDFSIKRSDRNTGEWHAHDWVVGNSFGRYGQIVSNGAGTVASSASNTTSPEPTASTPNNDLIQDLSTAPQTLAHPTVSNDTFPSLEGSSDTSNNTSPSPFNDEEITIIFQPTTESLVWIQMLYQLRVLYVTILKSESSQSMYDRWPPYDLIGADTRVKGVDARMSIRRRRGLFPVEVDFADMTEGLRLILAELAKDGGNWVGVQEAKDNTDRCGLLHRRLPALAPPNLSTTSVGTTYEHLVAQTLRHLAFTLTHVGGRSDRGIDLLGHWCPPTQTPHPFPSLNGDADVSDNPRIQPKNQIPVIVQCKAHARSPSPSWIRELEGAIAHAPALLGDRVLGILVSKRAMTAGVREAVMKAGRGVMWVQVEEHEGERGTMAEGRIAQVLWNSAVADVVGRDLGTGVVYVGYGGDGRGKVEKELRLSWKGRVWEPSDETVKEAGNGEGQ
ncbi:uncharacterized protein KY384_008699 [Bacidia gigantensis]|uniref:uncharacterized protein n=1 Tax=Bacidia gigantensis TaxID=2732470 RepID=UPI001D058E3E|nr:uncharacterized protein KY384_008699 [Bacidia gigantensis]KAG8526499.1 hypothetical protein KY384_008699 [Bacidia gigantensis]